MKIAFYGGQTVGIVTLLTLLASKHEVKAIFAEDKDIEQIADLFNLKVFNKREINEVATIDRLKKSIDIFICCHGKKILKPELVNTIHCVNLHPCLYVYKGAYPIRRLIAEKNSRASVASHWMVEKVDAGETIVEEFKIITNVDKKTEAEVYSELYPLYAEVLLKTFKKLEKV